MEKQSAEMEEGLVARLRRGVTGFLRDTGPARSETPARAATTPATAKTPAEPSYAESRLEAVTKIADEANTARQTATREVQETKEALHKAKEAHDRARLEPVANPMEAMASLAAAEEEVAKTAAAHEAAKKKAGLAQQVAERSKAALRDAKRQARIEELAVKASLETYQKTIAPHVSGLRDALDAVRRHTRAVDEAFDRTNEASAELRAQGVEIEDLDSMHRAAPVLLAQTETTPAYLPGLVTLMHPHNGGGSLLEIKSLERLVVGDPLGHLGAQLLPSASEETLALAREELHTFLSARTRYRALPALQDARFLRGEHDEINRRIRAGQPPPAGHTMPELFTPAPKIEVLPGVFKAPLDVEKSKATEARKADKP